MCENNVQIIVTYKILRMKGKQELPVVGLLQILQPSPRLDASWLINVMTPQFFSCRYYSNAHNSRLLQEHCDCRGQSGAYASRRSSRCSNSNSLGVNRLDTSLRVYDSMTVAVV